MWTERKRAEEERVKEELVYEEEKKRREEEKEKRKEAKAKVGRLAPMQGCTVYVGKYVSPGGGDICLCNLGGKVKKRNKARGKLFCLERKQKGKKKIGYKTV
jgi:hypothetical protein